MLGLGQEEAGAGRAREKRCPVVWNPEVQVCSNVLMSTFPGFLPCAEAVGTCVSGCAWVRVGTEGVRIQGKICIYLRFEQFARFHQTVDFSRAETML